MRVKKKKRQPRPPGEQSRVKAREKKLDKVLSLLLLLSVGLVIWGISIYRTTIIEPKYLWGVISVGTIVAAVILRLVARDFLGNLGTIFRAAVMGGGTAYFLTLYLNRELADKELSSETFDIIETGNLAKGRRGNCRQPYAIIDFYGHEKQLLFYCEFEESIQTYRKVQIDYFKGYFNFPVVHNQALVP